MNSSLREGAAWFGAAAGSVALALGVLLIVLAAANNSAAALIVGSIVGGVGFGLAFLGSLRALSARIPPSHRAGVMSAFFLAAYAALSAPAVLAGLLARPLGLESTFEILGSMDAALALVVAAQAWRTRPRTITCTSLKITDDRAKNARSEKAWPEWPGPILRNRRQLP